MELSVARSPESRNTHAGSKAEKDSDSTEARQRGGVHVPFLARHGDPSARRREVSHVTGQDESSK
jgi:hypothetical protein